MMKGIAIGAGLVALAAAWFFLVYVPLPLGLRTSAPERTAFMEHRLRQADMAAPLELRHEWVPLERISPHLRRAVVVAEDGRFYEHAGVDWAAVREELKYGGGPDFSWTDRADLGAALAAFRYYRQNRDRIRGRSTITQQLAKNLYLSPERSGSRKVREYLIARRLERVLDKDRILELYLNTAEWGPGIFGAEAAARHYFGRPAAELTREQAAALAATLPHPLSSNPRQRPGRMEWRKALILERMGSTGRVATVPLEPASEPPSAPRDGGPPLLGDPLPDQPEPPATPELQEGSAEAPAAQPPAAPESDDDERLNPAR
jgi:monofunctional glycosyltransferase